MVEHKIEHPRLMPGWGLWRGERELLRGIVHSFAGIVGWVILHFLGASLETMGIILLGAGTALFLGDRYRVWLSQNDNRATELLRRANRWVAKYWFRDTEARRPANVVASLAGFGTAWLVCWMASAPWIAAACCLLFSLVDPVAKLGRYWPIRRINAGWGRGKSWGGMLYGGLAGMAGCASIIVAHLIIQPFFPSGLELWQVAVIYLAGASTASVVELVGGKADNFLIPAASSLVMVLSYAIARIL